MHIVSVYVQLYISSVLQPSVATLQLLHVVVIMPRAHAHASDVFVCVE